MGCYPYFEQLGEINKALHDLIGGGFGPGTSPYELIYKMRGEVLGKLSLRIPSTRVPSLLKLLALLSPGELKVWFDIEVGWMVEGRLEPGAPPVVRRVSAEDAMTLLKPEPPADLVHRLLQPETYFGE